MTGLLYLLSLPPSSAAVKNNRASLHLLSLWTSMVCKGTPLLPQHKRWLIGKQNYKTTLFITTKFFCAVENKFCIYLNFIGFGGLGVACWPSAPKFAGSNPAEKILSTPSFGGEVKPSVPCRRFAACKRSLNGVEVVISAKLPDILAHSSHFRRWDLSRRGGRGGTWWWKVGTPKKRGKAMASYP